MHFFKKHNISTHTVTLAILIQSTLALTTLALASESRTVIHGEPYTGDVLVESDAGLVRPEIDITDEHAPLFNKPGDGSDPVLLRQVPTLYITDGLNPVVIDYPIDSNNHTRGLALPGEPNPITFGEWLDISGTHAKIKVRQNGTSKINIKFRGLLPNSIYGIWQFDRVNPLPPGPFAGIPNAFVTDMRGRAEFSRILPFNILEIVDQLMVVYHADHMLYGGRPSNKPQGTDAIAQVVFEIPMSTTLSH